MTVAGAPPHAPRTVVARRLVAGLAALVVVGVLAALGWAWRHPTALPAPGFAQGVPNATPGVPLFFAVLAPVAEGAGSLEIHEATAQVTGADGDGSEDLPFFVCTVDPAAGVTAFLSGDAVAMDEQCSQVVPAVGATMAIGEGADQQLVVGVVPRPGRRVEIEAVHVTYSHGWQRGTQTIPVQIEVGTSAD